MTDRPQSQKSARVCAHPHGLLGYVVDDDGRTRNVIRLLRWPVIAAVTTTTAGVLALCVMPQAVSATLAAAVSTAVAGKSLHAWRRKRSRHLP